MGNETAAQADFSFVHLTDTHIMAGGKWKARSGVWEFDTNASLRQVIEAINTLEPRPAFAVLGGDLASPDLLDHDKAVTPEMYDPSYVLLQQLLRPLPCHTYMLMGNHDNRTAFRRVFGSAAPTPEAPHSYSFDYQGYHFIALDSLHGRPNRRFSGAVHVPELAPTLEQAVRERPGQSFAAAQHL